MLSAKHDPAVKIRVPEPNLLLFLVMFGIRIVSGNSLSNLFILSESCGVTIFAIVVFTIKLVILFILIYFWIKIKYMLYSLFRVVACISALSLSLFVHEKFRICS